MEDLASSTASSCYKIENILQSRKLSDTEVVDYLGFTRWMDVFTQFELASTCTSLH